MSQPHARGLMIGLIVTTIIVGAEIVIERIWLSGADWPALAIIPLAFAIALLAVQGFSGGSSMHGLVSLDEFYADLRSRGNFRHDMADYKQSNVHARWLWAAAPPFIALILVILLLIA